MVLTQEDSSFTKGKTGSHTDVYRRPSILNLTLGVVTDQRIGYHLDYVLYVLFQEEQEVRGNEFVFLPQCK